MDGAILALKILIALGFVVFGIVFYRRKINPYTYFKKDSEGQGIFAGVILVIAAFLLFILISATSQRAKSAELEYLNWVEIYFGLDQTFKLSPQCESGLISDKITSNVGFRFNALRDSERKTHLNIKYTHHSCAFNIDREQYDALGFELTHRFEF